VDDPRGFDPDRFSPDEVKARDRFFLICRSAAALAFALV